jgi:hypothetical protein
VVRGGADPGVSQNGLLLKVFGESPSRQNLSLLIPVRPFYKERPVCIEGVPDTTLILTILRFSEGGANRGDCCHSGRVFASSEF